MSDGEKKVQINLPGSTIQLDWRSSRVLVVYRFFCLLIDSAALILAVTKDLIVSLYRQIVPIKPKDLTGQLALVAGSGHGIGPELCIQLGKLGATVICVNTSDPGNNTTKERLEAQRSEHYLYQCDVSDREDLDRVADHIMENLGVPALLIHNAVPTRRKTFLNHTQEEVEETFTSNVIEPMLLIQKFLPFMLSDPSHRHQIVAISSIVGMLGTPNMVPYSATKFALTGFMEGLHYELKIDKVKNIALTTVHPFLVADHKTKPCYRYEGLIGIVSVRDAVQKILLGIRREESEVYVPTSLYFVTRLLRALPRSAQTKLLEFVEFGSGP